MHSQSISKERDAHSPLLPFLLPHPVMCLGLELPLNAHRKISKCEERNFRRVSSTREEYNGERRKRSFYISLDSLAKKICALSRANFLKII
jgi:hypothetical protein